ncbi:GIY-YIG nuclease family protein [Ectothiorhodospira haloalkaliphila]|uniref:GIY-YIG nuclease family protein n=1 Tax=Ectothiorhodospira haloalkaliphila TaxID=421628 RepID=UPI00047EE048|nr:GIY-YIG nuclease family protein [Ectothiorhodospira haloalkaliphila]
MTQGRSIRLFLVDGTATGLITAEIMNWTGHVIIGPRTKLAELVKRPECNRTGIYFLIGPDPDNSLRPLVYIGETDDVGKRLKQHNRTEEQGGKDFWERVCLVTSKDQNLTKAHVKYLESQLISRARDVGRCSMVNGTAHEYIGLPESDQADMAFFVEQIRTVLPVLGLDFLRDTTRPSSPAATPISAEPERSPIFTLELRRHGIRAQAQEIDGEFFVLKGSQARSEWRGPEGGYQNLFRQLCDDGVLRPEHGQMVFTDDQAFSSPSAAAAVVSGRTANGRIAWVVADSGQSYAAWQDQRVTEPAIETQSG